jgi:hypothetical protein
MVKVGKKQAAAKKTAKKTAARRVPVTERAIVQRINRLLGGDNAPDPWNNGPYQLVALRGAAAEEFGDWVLVPTPNSADVMPLSRIERDNVDLEAFGREIGALKPWEEVAT